MSSSSGSRAVPAGWYPDPRHPEWRRYWDGARWTEQTDRPVAPAKPQLPKMNGLQLLFAYMAACTIPIVGFVAGTMAGRRGQGGHATALWILGVVSLLIYLSASSTTY
jgi:hypothetical protein